MAAQENGPHDGFGTQEDKHRDSFLEHNERMRLFRESHPTWAVIRLAHLNMTVPYCVGRSLMETGGSAGSMDGDYWVTLVPLQEVTARRFGFN